MSREYDFTLSESARAQSLSVLEEYGLVHIPGYVSQAEVAQLNDEFEELFSHEAHWLHPLDYSVGRGLSIDREDMDSNLFPATSRLFGSEEMRRIVDAYLGAPNLFNHQIYVVNDVVGSSHLAQDLHYDRTPTLKFFLYLTDTVEANGAFTCVPGSQEYAREQQRQNREAGYKPKREITRQLPPELATRAMPIEGSAGTMIIFHTDVLHKAGHVSTGERRVMRGHSRVPDQVGLPSPAKRSLLRRLLTPLTALRQ